MSHTAKPKSAAVLTTADGYFSEVVQSAITKLKFETTPSASKYIVKLLESYVVNSQTKMQTTLAEAFLKANLAEGQVKRDMLRQLGDTSLYVSGFFGDSLRRKIIDIDYYADIGGAAYASLAGELNDEIQARTYVDFAKRFLEYVDLLTYISQKAFVQSNQDLLRLYERYVLTGSELAREQLMEKGLLATEQIKKSSAQ
jgi:Mor family transcriptional regulator